MEREEDPRPTPHSHWHLVATGPAWARRQEKTYDGKDKKTCQGQASGGREEEGGWDADGRSHS